jgi:hypothetical protein
MGEEEYFEEKKAARTEQKKTILAGIPVTLGPSQEDDGIRQELYLPKAKIGGESGQDTDNIIILPDDEKQQKAIIDSLPKLAEQAKGDSNKLYGLITSAIEDIQTQDE